MDLAVEPAGGSVRPALMMPLWGVASLDLVDGAMVLLKIKVMSLRFTGTGRSPDQRWLCAGSD